MQAYKPYTPTTLAVLVFDHARRSPYVIRLRPRYPYSHATCLEEIDTRSRIAKSVHGDYVRAPQRLSLEIRAVDADGEHTLVFMFGSQTTDDVYPSDLNICVREIAEGRGTCLGTIIVARKDSSGLLEDLAPQDIPFASGAVRHAVLSRALTSAMSSEGYTSGGNSCCRNREAVPSDEERTVAVTQQPIVQRVSLPNWSNGDARLATRIASCTQTGILGQHMALIGWSH
ncbi:hypothetical protein HGRIS_001392 [Hohenbuehelia grisea]|uniref:Uncharacterized protein n=1 Tax=Hohenbuehelia grisea TaxID=104357 RepID=A0ABR3IPF8_9AGAR